MIECNHNGGRPEASYVSQVQAAIRANGAQGMTPQQIRDALPNLTRAQAKNAMERLVDLGRVYRIGGYRELLMFEHTVSQDAAKERHAQFMAEQDQRRRQLAVEASRRKRKKQLDSGMKPQKAPKQCTGLPSLRDRRARWPKALEFVKANPGCTYEQLAQGVGGSVLAAKCLVGTLEQFGLAFRRAGGRFAFIYPGDMAPEQKAALLAPVVKEHKAERAPKKARQSIQRKTQAINVLADKYRGTAAPKERVAVVVTGLDTTPVQRIEAPKPRFHVDKTELNGLSKLPLGVYAEPASRWAAVATDRRAA